MKKRHQGLLGHTKYRAPLNCAGSGHTKWLASKAAFAKETAFRQDGDDSLPAIRAHNREFHIAALDEEHGICDAAL
jgi:hypothetical protein